MKKIKYFFEYMLARFLVFLIGWLPWNLLPFLGGVLGRLTQVVLSSRRRLVDGNLAIAFPHLSREEREKIGEGFWRHIVLVFLESLKGLRESPDWFRKHVILENEEVLREALKTQRGVLIHSGHFGNWEFMNYAIALAGYPLCGIGRRQKNPYFDRWLNASRARFGTRVLNHHQAIRETQVWLKKNGCLGILGDHNLYKGGIFVDFFCKPAATTTLTALLHLKLGSPIIGAYCWRSPTCLPIKDRLFAPLGRLGDGKHHIRFEKIMEIDTTIPTRVGIADREEQVRRITEILAKKLEDWIRENPVNWLWGHNRWKRNPQ